MDPAIVQLYFILRTIIMLVSHSYYPACVPRIGLRAVVSQPTCRIPDPGCIGFRAATIRFDFSAGSHPSTCHDRDDSISTTTSSLIHPRAPPWARVSSRTRYLFILLLYYYAVTYTSVGFASSTEVPETGGTRSLDTGTVDQRTSDDLVNIDD